MKLIKYIQKILPNLKVINVLTGYVPISIEQFEFVPINKRKIDVGYRSRNMPLWMGDLAYEKNMIASELKKIKSFKLAIRFFKL